MRKLFRNPKAAVYLIVVFIVLLISRWLVPARASELRIEGGSAVLRGETPALGLHITWPQTGPVGTDYEAGFVLIGESSHYQYNPNVIALHAALVDCWRNLEAGLGFYGMNVEHEYTCRFGFHLLARYRFTDRIATTWRHYSSAGSCTPNAGRDLVMVSWRF